MRSCPRFDVCLCAIFSLVRCPFPEPKTLVLLSVCSSLTLRMLYNVQCQAKRSEVPWPAPLRQVAPAERRCCPFLITGGFYPRRTPIRWRHCGGESWHARTRGPRQRQSAVDSPHAAVPHPGRVLRFEDRGDRHHQRRQDFRSDDARHRLLCRIGERSRQRPASIDHFENADFNFGGTDVAFTGGIRTTVPSSRMPGRSV